MLKMGTIILLPTLRAFNDTLRGDCNFTSSHEGSFFVELLFSVKVVVGGIASQRCGVSSAM
jgi:hypothetical protein